MPIRVRVGAVVVREGRILLVNHRRLGRSYWVLPGGALEPGESLAASAEREVREETGLHVAAERFLYLVESFARDGGRHSLDVIFLARAAGGGETPRAVAGWAIEQPEFVPLEKLPGLVLLPPIAREIGEDVAAGFARPPRLLSNRWVDIEIAPASGSGAGHPEARARERRRMP